MGVWFDDEMPEHPKLEALGDDDAARWLHAAAIFYCNRNLTGGWITKGKALRLTAQSSPRRISSLLAVLVPGKGPLWEEHGDRYYIHDYEEHQRSAEKRRAEEEAKKLRRSEHARKAALARHGASVEQQSSMDRADIEHGYEQPHEHQNGQEVGIGPAGGRAGGGALPKHAQALAGARVGRAPGPLPFTPVVDPPPQDTVGGERLAEEEDHPAAQGEPPDPVLAVAQLVAERRYGKLTDPPPAGFRRDRWLETTAADVLAKSLDGLNIRTLLAGGSTVEAIVDLFEPPDKPATVAQLYPIMGQPTESPWDLDEAGQAVARVAP